MCSRRLASLRPNAVCLLRSFVLAPPAPPEGFYINERRSWASGGLRPPRRIRSSRSILPVVRAACRLPPCLIPNRRASQETSET